MRKAAIGLCLALATSACQTVPVAAPAPQVSCPERRHYTAAEEKAIGQAIEALDAANPLVGAMTDYTALLKEIEACEKATGATFEVTP